MKERERVFELDGDLRVLARWLDLPRIASIAVSPDSRSALLVTRKGRGAATLLPLEGGPPRRPPFEMDDVTSVSWTLDGMAVLAGTLDARLACVFWDVDRDERLDPVPAQSVVRHLDGGEFVSVIYRGTPRLQRWTRKRDLFVSQGEVTLRMGSESQFDPDRMRREYWRVDKAESIGGAMHDGRVIASHCVAVSDEAHDQTVSLWDVTTGERERVPGLAIDFGPGDSAHGSPDGSRVLLRKWWGEHWLASWSLAEARALWRKPMEFSSSAFAVDPLLTRCLYVLQEGRVQVCDTSDGSVIVGARILPHRFGIAACAIAPDGRMLIATDDDVLALVETK